MIVRYSRIGGRVPPPDNEGLQIDEDGSFTMWRSIAPAIGRFDGKLEPSELNSVKSEVKKAAAAGDFSRPPSRDGSVDSIDIDGAHASLGSNDYAEGDWGALITHLRRLLDDLVRLPRAAVGIELAPDGRRARLVHLGQKPIAVDLSRLSVRAVLWGRGYRKLGDWTSATGQGSGPSQVEAGDSWSFPLPFEHGLSMAKDRVLHVYAKFAVTENGQRAEVSAQRTPPVPE
jgi:hypothetical protein